MKYSHQRQQLCHDTSSIFFESDFGRLYFQWKNVLGMEVCEYYPNEMRPPTWVKDYFAENNVEPYQSRREEIIEKCLLQEADIDLSDWDIENCDIQTLAYISNCGLNFENEAFKMVMEKFFPYMISIISKVKHYHEFFDTYAVGEIKTFVENSLIGNQKVSYA